MRRQAIAIATLLVAAVPLSDVDAIEVKKLGLGSVVTVTVRGSEFKLEANAARLGAVSVSAVEGVERPPHDLDVLLRHRPRSISQGPTGRQSHG